MEEGKKEKTGWGERANNCVTITFLLSSNILDIWLHKQYHPDKA